MNYGGEEKTIDKLKRLESYLSEGLPRYQDILKEQNRTMPKAPDGIEYRDPGIMESQIFTVLTKRFKSGRLSFSKFGATCLAKICAIKVQDGTIKIETIQEEILVDNSIEDYLKEIKESLKATKRALINLNTIEYENTNEGASIDIDTKSPIYQALKLTPISELDYII